MPEIATSPASVVERRGPRGATADRWRLRRGTASAAVDTPRATPPAALPLDLAPEDPLIRWMEERAAPVDLDHVPLESAGVLEMRDAGVRTLVPLMSGGELVGLLALGEPAHEQAYSRDVLQLLDDLAGRAGSTIRVAQLVAQRAEAARRSERVDHELELARQVQQQLLPQSLPELPGWELAARYQPASQVGGDFYDVVDLGKGQWLLVAGDVTDHGVPAALVMSSARTLLHAEARPDPAALLSTVNDLLCEATPEHMFVTCLAMVVDARTGQVVIANAGHNPPLVRRVDGRAEELMATGVPLGLLPGMRYEPLETVLLPGEAALVHSDGLVEARDAEGEMFGFPRLRELVRTGPTGQHLIDACMTAYEGFVEGEQEDDITLVTVTREAVTGGAAGGAVDDRAPVDHLGDGAAGGRGPGGRGPGGRGPGGGGRGGGGRGGGGSPGGDGSPADELEIDRFEVPSVPGTERAVMDRVGSALVASDPSLLPGDIERLGTAVAESTMNAIEHGNGSRAEVLVGVRVVRTSSGAVVVEISDEQVLGDVTLARRPDPDIDLKLAGLQSPRGWGLFLVRSMVEGVSERTANGRHVIRLTMVPGARS